MCEQCVIITKQHVVSFYRRLVLIVGLTAVLFTMKGKAFQSQARTDPLGLQEVLPLSRHAWRSFLLDAESTPVYSAGRRTLQVNDKLHWSHRESKKRPSDLQGSATNKLSVGFHAGDKFAFENKNKNKNNTNLVTADLPLSDTFHNSLCPVNVVW